ncbi:MAG TPA: GNAT family N-acetyltransferase [Candidatus Binataceae bacterium]|nr:GNAT family N-acetyltransferase [Candidatus Binataceae bacterium]
MPAHRKIRVIPVKTPTQLRTAISIRIRVFVREQRIAKELEVDELDNSSLHALAIVNGKAVGTGRMYPHDRRRGIAKIGRMAVIRRYRGLGVGRAILEYLMKRARAQGYRRALLHAQLRSADFYSKCGFRAFGPIFDEVAIPHRKMSRAL